MRKILLFCCLFIGGTPARAQETHPNVGTPEEKAKGLQKELILNDRQTEQIAAIYKVSAEKFEKIKKGEHGNTDKMVVAGRPLREATIKKIKNVLPPVQAAKHDRVVKNTRGGGSGWSDGWSSTN